MSLDIERGRVEMADILIIDHNQKFVENFSSEIARLGHRPAWSNTLSGGLSQLKKASFDLVILQANLPDGFTLEAIPLISASAPGPEVIVIGDNDDPLDGEQAITNGAWDFVKRTPRIAPLKRAVTQVLEYRRINGSKTDQAAFRKLKFDGVLGDNPRMNICTDILSHAVESDAPVLITGETGTGKELFARAVHNNSKRADGNFVILDCAALPETLVESTLFGNTKGAYTGASSAREGLIKQADGGTLFLDEIGELPQQVQTSFLRVLETNRFRPVGAGKETYSNFRIIAATNQDLDLEVEKKRFRKDLLFRLRTLNLQLPPLREHMEDIPAICEYHLRELCEAYETEKKELSDELLVSLTRYSWPGNTRELVNALEHTIIAAREETLLFSKHLPTNIRINLARKEAEKDAPEAESNIRIENGKQIVLPTLNEVREASKAQTEKNYLKELMGLVEGDIQSACQVADVSRSRLYSLLKKYNVARS